MGLSAVFMFNGAGAASGAAGDSDVCVQLFGYSQAWFTLFIENPMK